LLLAARVMQAPDSAEREQVFKAEGVTYRNGVLRLDYEYKRPNSVRRIKSRIICWWRFRRNATPPVRSVCRKRQAGVRTGALRWQSGGR